MCKRKQTGEPGGEGYGWGGLGYLLVENWELVGSEGSKGPTKKAGPTTNTTCCPASSKVSSSRSIAN